MVWTGIQKFSKFSEEQKSVEVVVVQSALNINPTVQQVCLREISLLLENTNLPASTLGSAGAEEKAATC